MTIRVLSKTFAAGALALALSVIGSAQAAEFEFKFTGTNVQGDVVATTSSDGSQQAVISIRGWLTDSEVGSGAFTVTGLSSYAGADNFVYLASPYVDFGGLSFTTDTGGAFNLGLGGSNATGLVLNAQTLNAGGYPGQVGSTNVDMTATAVPEPSSIALFAAGLLGLIGVKRRRQAR